MIFNSSNYNQHWKTKKLSELGLFNRGKSRHRPRNDSVLFCNGIHPLIQTGEIKESNLYINSHEAMYNDFGLAQSKLWPKNTLCITIAANIAETALLGYPMCFPDSVVGFNAYKEEISEIFMHYVFTYIRRAIQNSASGSIQDNINIDYLAGLNFKIPLKEYQDKVANILSVLDMKIEINNRINAELEAIAKTLYDYWFVQFDFPDNNGKPYKSSGGKMLYNETLRRKMPEGWEVKSLSKWIAGAKIGDWGKESQEENYALQVSCIRGADINALNGKSKIAAPKRFISKKNSEKLLSAYDLIIEISGGSPTQSTGRMAFLIPETLLRFKKSVICSNFCKAIYLVDNNYFYNFIYQWHLIYDNKILFGWEGKTSGIKNLLFDAFVNNHNVSTPPQALAKKFYEIIDPLQQKKQKLLEENENIASLRDWLLPMLMNGQVTVR